MHLPRDRNLHSGTRERFSLYQQGIWICLQHILSRSQVCWVKSSPSLAHILLVFLALWWRMQGYQVASCANLLPLEGGAELAKIKQLICLRCLVYIFQEKLGTNKTRSAVGPRALHLAGRWWQVALHHLGTTNHQVTLVYPQPQKCHTRQRWIFGANPLFLLILSLKMQHCANSARQWHRLASRLQFSQVSNKLIQLAVLPQGCWEDIWSVCTRVNSLKIRKQHCHVGQKLVSTILIGSK